MYGNPYSPGIQSLLPAGVPGRALQRAYGQPEALCGSCRCSASRQSRMVEVREPVPSFQGSVLPAVGTEWWNALRLQQQQQQRCWELYSVHPHSSSYSAPQRMGTQHAQLSSDWPSWQTESGGIAFLQSDATHCTNLSADTEQKACVSRPDIGPRHIQMDLLLGKESHCSSAQECSLKDRGLEVIQNVNGDTSPELEAQGEGVQSVLVNDGSILVCVTRDAVRRERLSEGSYSVSADSCLPRALSHEPTTSTAITQTLKLDTSDKHINTVVQMADLDYIAEEFLKLRLMVFLQKKKSMRSVWEQRVQQAELALLTLQFIMCKQYCCTSFCSAEEKPHPQIKDLPTVNTLHKLESDWEDRKLQILAGVPLETLEPLCVGSFCPAQIIADTLNKASFSPRVCPGLCLHQEEEKRNTEELSSSMEQTLQLQEEDGNDSQSEPASCEELNMMESWFDAVEELQLPQHTDGRHGGSSGL